MERMTTMMWWITRRECCRRFLSKILHRTGQYMKIWNAPEHQKSGRAEEAYVLRRSTLLWEKTFSIFNNDITRKHDE